MTTKLTLPDVEAMIAAIHAAEHADNPGYYDQRAMPSAGETLALCELAARALRARAWLDKMHRIGEWDYVTLDSVSAILDGWEP